MDIRKAYDTVEWNALATILKEMNFPGKFVDWTMECVSTASFRYSINGQLTDLLRARRGLRQGDPISPLLFVVVMEYLHRGLANLSTVQQFKFHPRCKKLGITNISFADDIILFARGDTASVCNLMQVFNLFSQATGLYVQPSKFHVYFGGVQQRIKQEIIQLTGFGEGSIPFKYLGVPLASRKLSSQHCQPLIEKITGRIKHWTSHLLSYAGRCQLIKSVIFAISTYWLQVLPLPKQVLQRIDSICRSFLWCGSDIISRKAPIAWDSVCQPKVAGGLNIYHLDTWSQASLGKLLWNIHMKADRLWIRWLGTFYLKGCNILAWQGSNTSSWIVKRILKYRDIISRTEYWQDTVMNRKYNTGRMYKALRGNVPRVNWKKLLFDNYARPKANFFLWMALWRRIPTKSRLKKFGFIDDSCCVYCLKEETM